MKKKKKKKKKKDVTLNISKKFTTNFDHQFDTIVEHS